jgi:hypothetical protein
MPVINVFKNFSIATINEAMSVAVLELFKTYSASCKHLTSVKAKLLIGP